MVEDAQLLPNSLSVCARNGNKDLPTPLILDLSSVGSSHMRTGTRRRLIHIKREAQTLFSSNNAPQIPMDTTESKS